MSLVEYLNTHVQWWFRHTPVEVQGAKSLTGAATPLLLVLMLVEVIISAAKRARVYYFRQSISNLSAGGLSLVAGVLARGLGVFPYVALYRRIGLVGEEGPRLWWVQLIAFLGCDLAYYTFHRACHLTNLGWSAHVTHHSSPDFNLSTALRQGGGEKFVFWIFQLPLALFVPPRVLVFYQSLNTVYQFFCHTQFINTLGPLEWVMNTPSHHRVHHARNYGRANFGGMLIVWDRLFGTFEAEDRSKDCLYGLNELQVPLGTHNFLWQQTHHGIATLRLAIASRNPFKAFFTRAYGPGMVLPAMVDKPAGGKVVIPLPKDGYPCDPTPFCWRDAYVLAHFVLCALPATLWFTAHYKSMSPMIILIGCAALTASYTCFGTLLDGTQQGLAFECLRLLLLAVGAGSMLPYPYPAMVVMAGCGVSMAVAMVCHSLSPAPSKPFVSPAEKARYERMHGDKIIGKAS